MLETLKLNVQFFFLIDGKMIFLDSRRTLHTYGLSSPVKHSSSAVLCCHTLRVSNSSLSPISAEYNLSLWSQPLSRKCQAAAQRLQRSSKHSPGVKKTLTDVAQPPYSQSLAAFKERPECSQATSHAPFMIRNGIVEERQQHPHHRTKPLLIGYDSPWKGEEEQFLTEPSYPSKPPSPTPPSLCSPFQSWLACGFSLVSPPPFLWHGRMSVWMCGCQGRLARTGMKRLSSRATREAVCGLSEHQHHHAQWSWPAQGMEVQLSPLLRSLKQNTDLYHCCSELTDALRLLIFSAGAEWGALRRS